MRKREIIHTFRGGVDEAHYEAEYKDSDGQWVSAAGGWKDSASILGEYLERDAALLAARTLRKTHGYDTRVVRVHP